MREKGWFGILQNLTYLTQVGLSMATPIVLLLLGCAWLVKNTGVGEWIFVPAIVLGLGAGASSFAAFARHVTRRSVAVPAKPAAPAGREPRGTLSEAGKTIPELQGGETHENPKDRRA